MNDSAVERQLSTEHTRQNRQKRIESINGNNDKTWRLKRIRVIKMIIRIITYIYIEIEINKGEIGRQLVVWVVKELP